ncbi:MAG: archease [Candidatus Omnitrophica bacterium]|nr:archease [Candidatus Omnitrophota bacterium]
MKKYTLIEHTADIGIQVYGRNLKELFRNAAEGMFEIIADLKNVRPKMSFKINLKETNIEDLLVAWLRELLYRYNSKGILFKKFFIKSLDNFRLEAEASGEKFNPKLHLLKTEVKAVTYSDLQVEKIETGFKTQIIFDI